MSHRETAAPLSLVIFEYCSPASCKNFHKNKELLLVIGLAFVFFLFLVESNLPLAFNQCVF